MHLTSFDYIPKLTIIPLENSRIYKDDFNWFVLFLDRVFIFLNLRESSQNSIRLKTQCKSAAWL